jgi:hypothetical protein
MTIDVRDVFPTGDAAQAFCDRALNEMAGGLTGSAILAIAASIRELQAEGQPVCNLTVGDFSPAQFRVPESLTARATKAFADGETNYPPAVGLIEAREAVAILYKRDLGLDYPVESVFMAGGARPPIFATFATTPSKSILACLALNDFISSKAAFKSISLFDAFVLFSSFFISSPSSASCRSRSFNSFAVSSPFHGS